jgi:hypothetical protein
MGCLCSKKKDVDTNYTNRIFVGTTNIHIHSEPLPIIEPIKTQRIIYEEKIKKIYYIEYNKQNDRRYKG